ncbi:MAG TPA: TonB-dependent receptor [Kofleriaceae bacterium]|nr:TonB-dependent receptor [Kofleriaceae bacterium]
MVKASLVSRWSLALALPLLVAHTARADEPLADPEPVSQPPATAAIRGRVIDGATGEGMPAASIQVVGGAQITAELDGTYTLALPAGTYTIVISTPDYIEQRRTMTVTDPITDPLIALDVTLAPVVRETGKETIEVFDVLDTRKDSAVLAERRAAATVSDAISAEQIARSPDSTASDAAKRMVAATVQDNRYIVVRGLGGRYSLTLLNGVPLPSPDPDVPAAPLDLFPAVMLTNLRITKTFAPDLPGNFAGGALDIETRSYPTKFTFKAKVGTAANSESTLQTQHADAGGSLDLFGYDDGTRALPSSIPATQLAGSPSASTDELRRQAAGFNNHWTMHHRTAAPSLSLAATLGDTVRIADQRLGYFASASYAHAQLRRDAHIARVGEADGDGRLPSVLQLDDHQGIEQAAVGGVASLGWTISPRDHVNAFSLYTHTGDATASQVVGTDNSTARVDRTRLSLLERQLWFGQLTGEHKLGDGAAIMRWQGNLSTVAQHEPDTRDLLRTQTPDGRYVIDHSSGSAERLFADLSDTTGGGGADVTVPLGRVRLSAGGAASHAARDYQARRFHFDVLGDAAFLPPEQAFSAANTGMSLSESTLPTDGYAATRTTLAAYAMADATPIDKLRVVGGARFEHSALDVGLASKIDLMAPPTAPTTRTDRDILPSLNVVYTLGSSSNLRAAYAMTVARPNFREIAPALYYDYVRRRAIGGNPDLAETKIHNADLRWETFFGDTELLAASVFGKRFSQPIEQTVEDAGDGQNIGFANTPRAWTYGVELEARVSLGRLARALSTFSLGANLSLIGSRITVGDTHRPLQGQSPYVANLDLAYASPSTGTQVDLLYNTFGRRIEEVGTGGAGNVYEQPFHRLDVSASQRLAHNLKLRLAGSNLLGDRIDRRQDDVSIYSYTVGITVVGSVELSLE